jgi:hypothetical protein
MVVIKTLKVIIKVLGMELVQLGLIILTKKTIFLDSFEHSSFHHAMIISYFFNAKVDYMIELIYYPP